MKRVKILRVLSFFLAACVGVLIFSCTRQEVQPRSDFDQETEINVLTKEEASAQALNIYKELFRGRLRGAEVPGILSVQKQALCEPQVNQRITQESLSLTLMMTEAM